MHLIQNIIKNQHSNNIFIYLYQNNINSIMLMNSIIQNFHI